MGPGPTLQQLLDRAQQAINSGRSYLDGFLSDAFGFQGGPYTPLLNELDRLRHQPDSDISRRQAVSLLMSVADVSKMPGLLDDLGYYATHPYEGLQVTTGIRDVSGLPGPNAPFDPVAWAQRHWLALAVGAVLILEGPALLGALVTGAIRGVK